MTLRVKHLIVAWSSVLALGCGDQVQQQGSTASGTAGTPPSPAAYSLFSAGDTTLIAAVDRSTLIFDATVVSFDTIHVPAGPPKYRRMNVAVKQILLKPDALDDFSGDTTVLLSSDSVGYARGSRAVFFGYGLLAGKQLVAQEVHRIPVSSNVQVDEVRTQVAAADSALDDLRIVDASNKADAVVLVQVDSIREINPPDSVARRGSEHTPEWKLASGLVVQALRAQDSVLVTHRVSTLFATGESEVLQDTAKLAVGKARILWLHRLWRLTPALRAGIDTTGRYFVLEPTDTRNAADTSRVANALAKKHQ